jgi:S-DNA-T family DNA segregation ATPase FtsK/SpoIIIE
VIRWYLLGLLMRARWLWWVLAVWCGAWGVRFVTGSPALAGLAFYGGLVAVAFRPLWRRLLWGRLLRVLPRRLFFIYCRWSWGRLAQQAGLIVWEHATDRWVYAPLHFERHTHGFTASGRLLTGQTPEDYAEQAETFRHAWTAKAVTVDSPAPGFVVINAMIDDPLSIPLPALPIPDTPDLYALPVGVAEDGYQWVERLIGRHWLIAGATGAGKGSVQWSLIRATLAAVRAGWVQWWVCDPNRMEFAAGRPLSARYASQPERMVELVELAASEMQQRADRLAGHTRQHEPTTAEPLIVLLIDELANLTAYITDRKLRSRFEAALGLLLTQGRAVGVLVVGALQDPRKEVINLRNLFPVRIALRLDEPSQVDQVLGDGALDKGATAHRIPADEQRGAGIGYVVEDGSPFPRRVRAAHVTDADITEMVAGYGRPDHPEDQDEDKEEEGKKVADTLLLGPRNREEDTNTGGQTALIPHQRGRG